MKIRKYIKILPWILLSLIAIAAILLTVKSGSNSTFNTKPKYMEVSSNQIRAKYIEEKTSMVLPSSYIRHNEYIKYYVELIDNDKAKIIPIGINGFTYNGYYEVIKTDGQGNETSYKDKTHGSHAVIPYSHDKNCYEAVFYYDREKQDEPAEEKNIELTEDVINRMPAVDDFDVYIESVTEDGTIEKHEELYKEIPFNIEPVPIDKDVLNCIYEINYLVTSGEKAGENIFASDEVIAGIVFKIIDGKYIFDRFESVTNDIELLQTHEDGKVKFAVYFENAEKTGIIFAKMAVLKKNITVPEGKNLNANINLYNEIYGKTSKWKF